MFKLFFSLSSDFLFITILKENKCLTSIQKDNRRLHSENFSLYLKQALDESQLSLKDIEEIYFTSNPGGQAGLRISLAFILTLQTINPRACIYHINSLLFQANKKKAISYLTLDSKGSKYHAAVYQNGKPLIESQIISQEQLESLKNQFPAFLRLNDFIQVDFFHNFYYLKTCFQKLKKISEINH